MFQRRFDYINKGANIFFCSVKPIMRLKENDARCIKKQNDENISYILTERKRK